MSLNVYLRRKNSSFDFVLRPDDYEEYQNFLCNTLIGLNTGQLKYHDVKNRDEKRKLDISGIIEHVIQVLRLYNLLPVCNKRFRNLIVTIPIMNQNLCSKQRPSHHILSLGRLKVCNK